MCNNWAGRKEIGEASSDPSFVRFYSWPSSIFSLCSERNQTHWDAASSHSLCSAAHRDKIIITPLPAMHWIWHLTVAGWGPNAGLLLISVSSRRLSNNMLHQHSASLCHDCIELISGRGTCPWPDPRYSSWHAEWLQAICFQPVWAVSRLLA